jgi:hypothetical protein
LLQQAGKFEPCDLLQHYSYCKAARTTGPPRLAHASAPLRSPPAVRQVVERQMAGVQANHDQIKALRDGLRART